MFRKHFFIIADCQRMDGQGFSHTQHLKRVFLSIGFNNGHGGGFPPDGAGVAAPIGADG